MMRQMNQFLFKTARLVKKPGKHLMKPRWPLSKAHRLLILCVPGLIVATPST